MTYAEMKAAAEARKTLPHRLRTARANEFIAVMDEAADEIDRLNALIKALHADAREAERDAREEIRGAVAEAHWQRAQGDEYGAY